MAFPHDGKKIQKGEVRNPYGRPRKSFASVNKALKEQGVSPLSKSELLEAYGYLFNLTEEELLEIGKDKAYPFAMRILIAELRDKKTRAKALQDYRDYAFGRAKESSDIKITEEQPFFTRKRHSGKKK